MLAADDFIGVAEAAGLIGRIDHMVMLRCVQVLRRLMVRNKEVGVFCNVAAATLGNPATFAQCLDFLEANRALAPSFVLEFKQATFRNLGPTETEHLAALAQRGYRFSIDHVTDLRIEPRELADRGVRFIKVPAALLLDQRQSLGLRHPSFRPFRPARPFRHRPDRGADRRRARGGRSARLRRAVRPGLSVRAAPAVAARGRICYRRGRSEQGAGIQWLRQQDRFPSTARPSIPDAGDRQCRAGAARRRPGLTGRPHVMTSLRFVERLRDLVGGVEVILSDIWGVVHNGLEAFPEACEALHTFRAARAAP